MQTMYKRHLAVPERALRRCRGAGAACERETETQAGGWGRRGLAGRAGPGQAARQQLWGGAAAAACPACPHPSQVVCVVGVHPCQQLSRKLRWEAAPWRVAAGRQAGRRVQYGWRVRLQASRQPAATCTQVGRRAGGAPVGTRGRHGKAVLLSLEPENGGKRHRHHWLIWPEVAGSKDAAWAGCARAAHSHAVLRAGGGEARCRHAGVRSRQRH